MDIRVRFPDAFRYNYSDVLQFPVLTPSKQIVPLFSLAKVDQVHGDNQLLRENQRLMVSLTARLENRDLGSAIGDVKKMMEGIPLPTGTSYEIGGQYESQQDSFHDLLYVLALALGAVFIVLVIQFRAFMPALIILSAAPLSLVGVFAMLWITRTALTYRHSWHCLDGWPGGEEWDHLSNTFRSSAKKKRCHLSRRWSPRGKFAFGPS